MSSRDPFSDGPSIYGTRRAGADTSPSEAQGEASDASTPQRAVQGGTVPLPSRPVFPIPTETPGVEDSVDETDENASSFPQQPTFRTKAEQPKKGSTDDLFPEITSYEPEDDDIEDNVEDEEETVSENYEYFFDQLLEGNEEDYPPLSSDEEDLLEKHSVATDEEVSPTSLYSLATDEDSQTRVYVAENSATPQTLLERLAKDPDSDVREAVLENPNCSDSLYRSFALDPDDFVVATWLDNPRTTSEMVNPLHGTQNPFIAMKLIESNLVSDTVRTSLQSVFN